MTPTNSIQLANLRQRLTENDQSALKSLYDEFGNQLFQFAYAIIRSREMAEEIVEDVFIQVWDKRTRIGKVENLVWYLYVTTRNISYNYYRKYNRQRVVDLEELALPYYQITTTPEDIVIAAETLQQINVAINELPPRCRLIFKLVKGDGLKCREAANLLNLTEKTIENQLTIAFKKIHEAIKDSSYPPLRIAK